MAQVPEPDAASDFLAAYAPAYADLHATAPVKVRREGRREGGREGEDLKKRIQKKDANSLKHSHTSHTIFLPLSLFFSPITQQLKYLSEQTSSSLPSSLYSSTGQGCVSFRLLNLRDSYSFALMRGNVSSPLLLARSAAVGFKEPNEVGREGGREGGWRGGRNERGIMLIYYNYVYPFFTYHR